ncbi:MAG TPA: 50S ribosomal protein L13 [Candidatus Aminicenantes bacterium]|nr:50S ribosomal protein L13 [Acidobacteriota bacterium]HOI45205.1 50S ribosomal protein L13 [Candidatus Aminicenantes bacterium]
MKTYCPKKEEIERKWWLIDAQGKVLGRLATEVANLLRGKNSPQFAPHVDTGDFVIVVNAEKIQVTGNKALQKKYYSHSLYPGGLKTETLQDLLEKKPEKVIEKAVWGMIPKNKLGRAVYKKLKVYRGPEHPHAAQNPQVHQF